MADPITRVNAILRTIDELGEGTPEYHECLAFLLTTMARSQWRRADSIRASNRDRDKRRAAALKRYQDKGRADG